MATRPSTWRCTGPDAAKPADLGRYGAARASSTNVSVFDIEPEAIRCRCTWLPSAALKVLAGTTRWCCLRTASPSRGLHARIDQLHAHHDERLAEIVLGACAAAPLHVRPSCCRCSSSATLDLHQTTFAMGEAIAHVHALAEDGRLVRRWPTAGGHAALPHGGLTRELARMPQVPETKTATSRGLNPPCRRDAEPPSPDVLTPTW
jgi:hypothetical protein